jgi:hypothetical protein
MRKSIKLLFWWFALWTTTQGGIVTGFTVGPFKSSDACDNARAELVHKAFDRLYLPGTNRAKWEATMRDQNTYGCWSDQ